MNCDPHEFEEEYYGWRCKHCGLFYPNTAPLGAWLCGDEFADEDKDEYRCDTLAEAAWKSN